MNGLTKRIFYTFKPFIHRSIQIGVRRQFARYKRHKYGHVWPIDPDAAGEPKHWSGWPEKRKFALVLSHDVDTAKGYKGVLKLAELEEEMGFRSSFNFVPERYGKISRDLVDELRRRGFGVGIHGLKHDGKLFWSKQIFDCSARRINFYLSDWNAEGFSSPSMHRNLEWMNALNIEYSISTFDTDPFEPQPDGVGTIFPFTVYRNGFECAEHQEPSTKNPASRFFIELPYTLPQDFTLFIILKEKDIRIWKGKLDWIASKGGMALLNTHPDYMCWTNGDCEKEEYPIAFYEEFLRHIKQKYQGQYWHGIAKEVAQFWKEKMASDPTNPKPNGL
jgi:hypothetical protein